MENHTIVSDSAGIEIVDNGDLSALNLPVLVPSHTPLLDIGVLDSAPEYMFSDVNGALLLADGSIAVLDYTSRQLRFFSADGKLVRLYGGRGEGPGEFLHPGALFHIGEDSVAAQDYQLGRITIASAHRASEYPILGATPYSGERYIGSIEGNPFFHLTIDYDQPIRTFLLRREWQSADVDTLWGMQANGFEVPASIAGNSRFTPLPPHFAPHRLLSVRGALIYVLPDSERKILVLDKSGTVRRIVRWKEPGTRVTAELERRERERTAEDWISQGLPRMVEALPAASVTPPATSLRISADGGIWIERFRFAWDSSSRRWLNFDSTGAARAVAELPLTFTPTDFGADWVLGIGRNELGIQHVVRHRLAPINPR